MRPSPWLSSFIVAFGAVFVGAGVIAAYGLAIGPMHRAREAREWGETTCRITSAELAAGRSSKGRRTYSAEVAYAYEVGGQRYLGHRLAFTPSSANTRGDAEAIVARYPIGADARCWYDPASPGSVTLSRTVRASPWMAFPLPLLLSGLFVLRYGARRARQSRSGSSAPDGRRAFHRRGSGVPELLASAVIATVVGVTAYLLSELSLGNAAWIAFLITVVAVAWLAHELRCAVSVVTIIAPPEIARDAEGRFEHIVRTPFCAPPSTARAIAVEEKRQGSKLVEATVERLDLADGMIRIPGPPTRDQRGDSLTWYLEVRAHLPYGPDLYVRAPIVVR